MLSLCIAATALGTLLSKRPLPVAIGISVLSAIIVSVRIAGDSSLWMIGALVVFICSMPVTIITALVTENLLDQSSQNATD